METVRINKLIAHSGIASRRQAEVWIEQGRVTVDGAPAHLGQQVDPETAVVEVDGIVLPVRPGLVYYLVNKPVGVVSTVSDTHERTTVVDLVPAEPRVYPVGRLDRDSSGLLIVTNDGDLALRLTHPRFGVEKVYSVLVDGKVTAGEQKRLLDGVELTDGLAAARAVAVLAEKADSTLLSITMAEGRNREVRRMIEAVGHSVKSLFRTAVGPISDSGLRSGDYRLLTVEEVRSLYDTAAVGQDDETEHAAMTTDEAGGSP